MVYGSMATYTINYVNINCLLTAKVNCFSLVYGVVAFHKIGLSFMELENEFQMKEKINNYFIKIFRGDLKVAVLFFLSVILPFVEHEWCNSSTEQITK